MTHNAARYLLNSARMGVFLAVWCIACTLQAEEPPAVDPPTASSETPQKPQRGIDKLDRKSRIKVLAALAAFGILAFGMISLTWLGARVTRRYMNPAPFDHERIKSSAPLPDDWAGKPLVDNSEFGTDDLKSTP